MEYRNIDTDYMLYFVCKRYYSGELNQDQVYWKLESEGYSKTEIDNAIYDYYLVYERTKKLEISFVYLGIIVLSSYIIYKVLMHIMVN